MAKKISHSLLFSGVAVVVDITIYSFSSACLCMYFKLIILFYLFIFKIAVYSVVNFYLIQAIWGSPGITT